MRKIKITAVSYLNTKPLLYGILRSPLASQVELSLAIPSECARRLRDGEVDLALTPVAILPELDNWQLVSDYCIGAVGAVKTVCIYSDLPLEQLDSIYLDYHSRSSVALTRLLLDEYWQLAPSLIPAEPGYEELIGGKTGGLVIGDRTIGLDKRFPYVYDLAEAWYNHTGLPFVFAAWVAVRPLPQSFIDDFNEALRAGLALIPELNLLLPSPQPDFSLEEYYTRYISYNLDAPKRAGLDMFLSRMMATSMPVFE